MVFESVLAVVAGYLLGSFPSAYIAGRVVKHQDIRRLGGGNVGTLNTLREVGIAPGVMVFVADVAKGALSILAAKWLGVDQWIIFAAGLASVAGHSWSVFLRFKGGRGGATGYGIFLALTPAAAGIVFVLMLAILILTSNGRLSLIGGFVAQPLLIWAFGGSLAVILYAVAVPALLATRMIYTDRHKILDPDVRKNLIIDRNYTWWQSKRALPADNKNSNEGKNDE
jgi:glycerol-3-phosphate acyltransferase PlsY